MIPRVRAMERIRERLALFPVVALLGPRQCGKTTLARALASEVPATLFDLENPVDLRRLSAPLTALSDLTGLVILDEVQRRPELFELIRVLVDRPVAARFLLLGSASPELVQVTAESLAGRIGFVDLSGFDLQELDGQVERLWLRGGFPRSFLAPDDRASLLWREDFVRTFLERDIPQLGIRIPSETLRRFWTMVAHCHGQVWNAAELARSLGSSEPTARRYLDILAGAFVARVLPPWFENIAKRQVKSPKVFVRDSGILHALLGLGDLASLRGHPKLGASWEGFALEQTVTALETRDAYFWATHGGAELDLLLLRGGKRYGFEFKYADAPGTTRSMRVAADTLRLEHLWVVYPGRDEYALDAGITAIPMQRLSAVTASLS
ncbi:MAG: ATP-binding protein [Chloroflexi bacterium]|nr:ATP-binding protein [Chloroflexota bacterium]